MRLFLPAVLLVLLPVAAACGAPAAAAPSDSPASGDETADEAPPPPEPSPRAPTHVRIVHAAPGPDAASITVHLGDDVPALEELAFHQGSPYVEVGAGTRELVVHGVSSVETGDTAELARLTTTELAPEARYSIVVHGLVGEEPPLALAVLPDRTGIPPPGAAAMRIFHALLGVDTLDACAAGAAPRDPATPLAAAIDYGRLGPGDDDAPYLEVPAEGELVLQLRAPHATPCRGRIVGVARTALTPGANHTLVIVGRTSGRPRVERELVVCTEGETASCIAVPITAR